MTFGSGKVITTLQDRWRIDQDIQEMLHVRSQQEFTDRARSVAARGEQVIPVLLRRLDDADARTLSALGVISSLYPEREQILNKLYGAAADLERPDRGRVSAMLILERFLDQETDPYLIATLDDPQFMAIESIKEMIHDGERDPRMLIEYTRNLADQDEETIRGVIDTLVAVGEERAVPALCLLAQHDQDALGVAALHALGRLHHPEAARGLQSILSLLSPDRRILGDRSLLKLRLKQVPIDPLPPVDGTWRALVSPMDGEGSQVIWFIKDPDEQGLCRFMGFSINDLEGIRQVYGHVDVPADTLPERRQRGRVHNVALPSGSPDDEQEHAPSQGAGDGRLLLHMLETEFDYGRRLVREGQAHNAETDRPVPVEYRLFGSWLWQYDDAHLEASRWQAPGPVSLFGPTASNAMHSLTETADLLAHPAFRGWVAYGDAVLQYAMSLMRRAPLTVRSQGSSELSTLILSYYNREMIGRLRNRLTAMSEWLWRAGDVRAGSLAGLAAETLEITSPTEHPFTRGMVELGLRAVIAQLRRM
jgi:hypothetical protein